MDRLGLRAVAKECLSGGVRTLIALHHGCNTKSESFASCRGRVNIFGGCLGGTVVA